MDKALFAGSFDPPTLGHLDLIRRAALLFKELTVGVTVNLSKQESFTVQERVENGAQHDARSTFGESRKLFRTCLWILPKRSRSVS